MSDEIEIPELSEPSEEELAERAMDGLRRRIEIPERIEPVLREEALKLAKQGVPKRSIFQRIFGSVHRLLGGFVGRIVDEAIDEVEDRVEDLVDDTVSDVDKFVDNQFDWLRGRTRRKF